MPSTSTFIEIMREQRGPLLTDWLREQLASDNRRPDLRSEAELRADSERFLDLFLDAVQNSASANLSRPEFQPLLGFLSDLARARVRQGATPSEVAVFVFSLKQPLYALLSQTYGDDAHSVLKEYWAATTLLDRLGLYTVEVHQQTREEVIRRQQEEMLELSTPVVQLWKGIVGLPLIGTLDSARTNVVMESLLQTIVQTGSEIAIIDITGVPTVDTLVAQHLLKTVAAARLMGADCIISGIRPQIAQTMVHLQIDLSNVITKATMAEALTVALKRTGHTIVAAQPPRRSGAEA